MKNQKSKFFILIGIVVFCILHFAFSLFAQQNLETLKDQYFKENKYSAFIDNLKDIRKKNPKQEGEVSYYIALSRYQQLKYLEESQNWDEYFSLGNDYRDELVKEVANAINLTSAQDSLNLYARCLLWQFHQDQQDAFAQGALKELSDATVEYADKKDNLAPLKYIADKLSAYGNKSEAKKVYNLYVDKLLKTQTREEELKKAADEAYAQGNISLATTIYDAYLNKIIKPDAKDKVIPNLFAIAEKFSYKDEGNSDPEYAEKLFKRIEELGGNQVFDEQALYLRAYNLEKARMYKESQGNYLKLIENFPQTNYRDEALFKCAMITTYILKDIEAGMSFFERLANPLMNSTADSVNSAKLSPQVISSIYQLGLFAQWKQDVVKAKAYYSKLKESAGDGFADTKELVDERLKELEKDGEIEYNLKTFLDASLKENFDMSRIDLKSSPYKIARDKDAQIACVVALPESGCMSVEVNYLWSGHLGKVRPSVNQPDFTASYLYPGTKEINLVVVSPSGIIDCSIDMLDVE